MTATREAHNRLAERYLTAWGRLENNLPGLHEAAERDLDGGYGLRHLAAHLEGAGRVEDVHRLLALETGEHRNTWCEAKEAVGDTNGFLADVTRAWRLAEKPGSEQNDRERNRAIGLQCRYALILASLNSLAQNIPPFLVNALIVKGIWKPAQGLAYACLVHDSKQRAETLNELAPYLSKLQLHEALVAAQMIKDAEHRAKSLTGVAPYLLEPLRTTTLHEALTATRTIEYKRPRAWALTGLAPHLPAGLRETVLHEALAAVRAITDKEKRAQVLTGLAPHLPEGLLPEALTAAWAIEDEWHRAEALTGLAPHLSELPVTTLIALWQELLGIWSHRSRQDLLSFLGALSPVIAKLGGKEAIADLFHAIQDMGRWWP